MSRYVDIEPYEKDGWYLQRRYRNSYSESIVTAPLISIPTAEARSVKHGRWADVYKQFDGTITMGCSICRNICIKISNIPYRYCPNCGARMDEVEE